MWQWAGPIFILFSDFSFSFSRVYCIGPDIFTFYRCVYEDLLIFFIVTWGTLNWLRQVKTWLCDVKRTASSDDVTAALSATLLRHGTLSWYSTIHHDCIEETSRVALTTAETTTRWRAISLRAHFKPVYCHFTFHWHSHLSSGFIWSTDLVKNSRQLIVLGITDCKVSQHPVKLPAWNVNVAGLVYSNVDLRRQRHEQCSLTDHCHIKRNTILLN